MASRTTSAASKGASLVAVLALAAGLSASLSDACNVYDTSLLGGDSGGVDAGVARRGGVGYWSGPADSPPGCFSARYPRVEDRPAAGNPGVLPPFYLAFQTLNTGSLNDEGKLDPEAWRNVGFDLDGTCTGSETCETPGQTNLSCKPVASGVPLDGAYCRDNTFGRLGYQAAVAPETSKAYGLNSEGFNCALCVGAYNYLFRISGYNGDLEDDQVRVDFYPSPGLEKMLPWDCSSEDWKSHPCFDSDQKWQIRDTALAGPLGPNGAVPESKLFDANAFVREGVLFVTLPDNTLFWFPGQRAIATAYPLTIQKGFVTAKLGRGKDGLWRATDGVVAGRAKRDDVIKGLRLVGICESDPNYAFVEQFVSGNLDLLASGERDPNKPCDAISLGIPFTAIQAQPGGVATVADLVECQKRPVAGGAPPSDAGAGDAGGD
jgi:hypothetical protein